MNSISCVWTGCLFGNDEESLLWHTRPGTRWKNIHLLNTILFLWSDWDNEANCTVWEKRAFSSMDV